MQDFDDHLRYLDTPIGKIDVKTEPQKFKDLADFNIAQPIDKTTQKRQSETPKTNNKKEIPKEFLNKSWEELYSEDKLHIIHKDYPEYYLKLRKAKFNY